MGMIRKSTSTWLPTPDAFFGSFLVRTQEMNTSQFFGQDYQIDKYQFEFQIIKSVIKT